MSDEGEMSIHSTCGDDVAAYALGALDPAEAEAFELHLESCTVCREELTAFVQAVNLLPTTVVRYDASPALRRRMLRAVADQSRVGLEPTLGARTRARRLARGRLRPAMAFAALAAVAILVFVAIRLSSSPAMRVINARVAGPGAAQLRVTGDRGELILHRFSAPPAGEIFEAWLERPHGAPSPTSPLFSVAADGSADVELSSSLRGVSLVMVTVEPAGGTRTPTHPAVLSARLA